MACEPIRQAIQRNMLGAGRIVHQRPVIVVGVGKTRRRDVAGTEFVEKFGRAGIGAVKEGAGDGHDVVVFDADARADGCREVGEGDLAGVVLTGDFLRQKFFHDSGGDYYAGPEAGVLPIVADAKQHAAEIENDQLNSG